MFSELLITMVTRDFRFDESFPVKTGFQLHRAGRGFLTYKHAKTSQNALN